MQTKPVAIPAHQKLGRKSQVVLPPVVKKAIFGQKVPKKCRFAVHTAPFGKVLGI